MADLERDILGDLGRALGFEWLLTDGRGGYGSATVLGTRTRREHGWLVVATRPPRGRMVLLSGIEETLVLGSERFELSTNIYSGAVHPEGYRRVVSFGLDPLPTLSWELPQARISRTIARVHGQPGLVVVYRYEGAPDAILELRPLIAYRRHDALQQENDTLRRAAEGQGDTVVLRPYALSPALTLRVAEGSWKSDGHWYRGFTYPREKEAGRDHVEDLFSPGRFAPRLSSESSVAFLAWAEGSPLATPVETLLADERRRLREAGSEVDGLTGLLRRGADAFLVQPGETVRAIVTAYPAEADTGREAPLALPGLCLTTGRARDARGLLNEASRHLAGMLFPSATGEWDPTPPRGSADASLLWTLATQRVVEATGDLGFLKARIRDVLFAAVETLRAGGAEGLKTTPDGLLADGRPTPRLLGVTPCSSPLVAIETQALWCNALLFAADLASHFGEEAWAAIWTGAASRAREAIQRLFWSEEAGHLADALTPAGPVLTLRPHQLFAIGLPHCLLPANRALSVLAAVERDLLTPVGLRACAPGQESDSADGAAWPAMMGLYFDAVIRLRGEEGKRMTREWLRSFALRLDEAGLGCVSERFAGQAPHRPAGQIAHAAATAELLRISHRVAGRPPATRSGTPPR